MNRSPILVRLLLIAVLAGFVVASLGALTSASAFVDAHAQVESDTVSLDADQPPELEPAVGDLQGDVTDLVHDTTGIDAGSAADDPTGILPEDADSLPGQSPSISSSGVPEVRPLSGEDKAAAGALAVASSAGFLLWLQNVLGVGMGRLFMAPMFSRIEKDALLDNDGRELLLTLVDENPGIGLKDLSERAGLGWGTTVYHMSRLEAAGFVASMKNGQHRHFFKNGHPAAMMKKHVAVLRNETAGNLARFLLATPGSTQSTIAKRLGLGAPTVTKYIKRMENQGLVHVVQDGRSKIVQPTGALQSALDHAAPMPVPSHPPATTLERPALGVA